jgi:hypothetical protein
MWKYIFQWAAQGVLFLIGVGVDLMPGNESWTPTIIICAIAFVWLIGTIIYYLIHRRHNSVKEKIEVKPVTGKRAFYERSGKTSWADWK